MDVLPGDGGDPLVIFVVVEYRDASCFGCCSDEKVGVPNCAVMEAALLSKSLVDVERSLPLGLLDRAVR